MSEQLPQPNPIAVLNDAFRQAGPAPDWYITQGANALPDHDELIQAVQNYNRFNSSTDPYGEHDYGSFVWRGVRTLWKIDYFDQQVTYWCDPLSPDCRRVLTVMLASKY